MAAEVAGEELFANEKSHIEIRQQSFKVNADLRKVFNRSKVTEYGCSVSYYRDSEDEIMMTEDKNDPDSHKQFLDSYVNMKRKSMDDQYDPTRNCFYMPFKDKVSPIEESKNVAAPNKLLRPKRAINHKGKKDWLKADKPRFADGTYAPHNLQPDPKSETDTDSDGLRQRGIYKRQRRSPKDPKER